METCGFQILIPDRHVTRIEIGFRNHLLAEQSIEIPTLADRISEDGWVGVWMWASW